MKKESYGMGILGGLIGGILASIPWILVYLYGNMMFSLLAVLIAMGALTGYRFMKGKQDEKLALFITIISLISVTIATLIIIPLGLLAKNDYKVSFENLAWLYQNGEFVGALMRDYFISVVFTFLGISGVTSELKKGKKPKFNLGNNRLDNEISIYKAVFEKHNALRRENAIEKEIILNEIEDINVQHVFKTLCMQKIIRKYKKKYYFDEACEQSVTRRFFLIYGSIIKWILFFLLVILIPIFFL